MRFLACLIGGWIGCVAAACGGSDTRSSPSPAPDAGDGGSSSTQLAQAIDRLERAEQVDLWVGDLDGDGMPEVAFSARAASAETSNSSGALVIQAQTAEELPDDAAVLTHDDEGHLVLTTALGLGSNPVARRLASVAGSAGRSIIQGLARGLRAASAVPCELLTVGVEFLSDALRDGFVDEQALAETAGALIGEAAPPPIDDTNFRTCLEATTQTLFGCFLIYVNDLLCGDREAAGWCYLTGTREHCYQVVDGSEPKTCMPDTPPAPLRLCTAAEHQSGCCNPEFVYHSVLRSDVDNQAPMALDPPRGQLIDQPITLDLAGPQLPSEILQAAFRRYPAAGALACMVNGAIATRNTITLSLQPDRLCATNTTQPGHVLQGQVEQCVAGDAQGVYSTIRGTHGEAESRFAWVNEQLGPIILGDVRDDFRANVQRLLGEIAAANACCLRDDLRGARLDFSNGVRFIPTGESANCDDVDAGSPMPDAGLDAGTAMEDDGGLDGGSDGAVPDAGDGGSDDGGGTGGTDPNIVPGKPGNVSLSTGDPHLRTFDGLRYDMQAGGEFVFARDSTDGLEVQLRTRRWLRGDVSVGVAVAARVGTDRVGYYTDDDTTRLNGVAVTFNEGRNDLPGGGTLYRQSGSNGFTLVWPDNAQLRVRGLSSVSVALFFPDGRRGGGVSGLFGDFDGIGEGDLASQDGSTVLSMRPSFEDFYGVFVESWRVTEDTSLFDYGPAGPAEPFGPPSTLATVRDLTPDEYADGSATCEAAGVPADWMDACILDVATTGDDAFADDLAAEVADVPASVLVELDPPACPALQSPPLCASPDVDCTQAAYSCNGTFPDCDCTEPPLPVPGPASCAAHADCPGGFCYAEAGCGTAGSCVANLACAAPVAGADVCGCNGATYVSACAALAGGNVGFTNGVCPPLDLAAWTQEGLPGNGNWEVAVDGLSVLQTLNGDPTFFVSPEAFIDAEIHGTFRVETTSDDDLLGFVLGYNAPLSSEGTAQDAHDFVLFDWKQTAQSSSGQQAEEGFTLSRVQGTFADPWAPFWGHNAPGVEVLATSYGDGLGWTENADHTFEVIYETNRIRIAIDGVSIFDVAGDFPGGRFGFYNFSQAQVRYRDFVATGTLAE